MSVKLDRDTMVDAVRSVSNFKFGRMVHLERDKWDAFQLVRLLCLMSTEPECNFDRLEAIANLVNMG